MSLHRAPVVVAIFLLVAIPTLALGYVSYNPASSIGVVAVVAAALLVSYRDEPIAELRQELTLIAVGAVVLYAGFVGELLLGIIAACAVYVTSFLTGPHSTLRDD